MAPETEFLNFFVSRSDEFNLKFCRLDWAERLGLNIFDFSCTLIVDGVVHQGRGLSVSQNEAIIKALGEAAERAIVFHNKCSGSGAAIHCNGTLAESAAVAELAERHYFFLSFFRKTPLQLRTSEAIVVDPLIEQLMSTLTDFGIRLELYQSPFHSSAKYAIVFGESCAKPFGFYIGGAFGGDKAWRQAALEAGRFAAHVAFSSPLPQLSLVQFLDLTSHTPESHDALAQNPQMLSSYEFLWSGLENEPLNFTLPIPDLSRVDLHRLAVPRQLDGLPAACIQASSSDVQTYFCGPTRVERINLSALGLNSIDEVHKLPHPFG